MFQAPEKFRVTTNHPLASCSSFGNNGYFMIPLSSRSTAFVIISDGNGWDHVSAHIISEGKERTPRWSEMCKIKDLFWSEEDLVVQYHPAKSDYVNEHKHTLHLWRSTNKEMPKPDKSMV